MGETRFERRKQASRARILEAALALFRRQGMDGTTIEEICEAADVAPRTFYNHFPRREDMVRALARQRLENLAAVLAEREHVDLVALFDEIATYLESSGDFYRELVAAMLAVGTGAERSGELHAVLVEQLKAGVARREVTNAHDPLTLADIVAGTLVAVLMNWTADATYSVGAGLHDAALALTDLLAPRKTRRR